LRWSSGALGCTNNPSYTQKMIDHPEEGEYARSACWTRPSAETDDRLGGRGVFQRKMVEPIAGSLCRSVEKSGGQHGYVSIQGDPINEDDPES
jgi:transaldolase